MNTAPIFISYRRAKNDQKGERGQGGAGELRLELEKIFGKGSVFQDFKAIQAGTPWEAHIPQAVQATQVVLVLIHGNDWLIDATYKEDRRLFQADDWVRKEIALALRAGKHIIPLTHKWVNNWHKKEAHIP